MAEAKLEHVNITVSDGQKTADMLCELFDWHIRWQGDAIHDGTSFHVGGEHSYLAIYVAGGTNRADNSYQTIGGLNHVGVVVEDLDLVEARVIGMGFTPDNHGDYAPGRRFYFRDGDGIEYEVISYA